MSQSVAGPAPTKPNPKTRSFEFRYEAGVKEAAAGSQFVDLWVPVAQTSPFQKVTLSQVIAPAGHTIEDEPTHGNRIFHVRVPASQLPLAVQFVYEVERTEEKSDLAAAASGATLGAGARARALEGSKLVPVGPAATELSGGFVPKGATPVAIARDAYDHVIAKMKYDKPAGKGWGTGSTEWACKEGYGNCTDFHAYFMSLVRTSGVPARFTMGVPLPTDKHEGEIAGYHCWAEFFADGLGWIPVDCSEADKVADKQPEMVDYYFGGITADRVEFTAGRDVPLVPTSANGVRNFFIYPYAEIDGKEAPKEAVTRRFSFKDRA